MGKINFTLSIKKDDDTTLKISKITKEGKLYRNEHIIASNEEKAINSAKEEIAKITTSQTTH